MSSEHNHSYGANKAALLSRLKRIEGQIRGIQKMIEDDRYCVDILTQLAAVKSATHQVALNLLDSHTHHCVKEALTNGTDGEEKIDELMDVVRKFTKG
ncbi:copper-sensing transcriptional repressor CsoR [Alicyclobacillus acidoterrestris]|uniref:metal-sensitive transcriptional regulator n=1 Tax=Alicyclobacillus suci TaxID=2816080 RepID=UPI001190A8B2|nr:metal-sensitive transcriptional regulator [Alicyclobacillus suci]GEO24401.1 copper-sensing transcriptional repressor CsoR [Alicyclobacillus acidoterrestris]